MRNPPMSALVLGLALSLGGCSQAADEAVDAPGADPGPAATLDPSARAQDALPGAAQPVPASDLVGEWRVAGVDGAEIDQPYAITASITAARIHVTADCINLAWDYTAERGSIATTRAAVEGCGRGLTASEEALVAALDGATGFGRTPANALEIFGPRHSVTLFSQ